MEQNKRKREVDKKKDNFQLQLSFKKKTIAILSLIVIFVLVCCGVFAYHFAGSPENDDSDGYIEEKEEEISTVPMNFTKSFVEFKKSREPFLPLRDHELRQLSLYDAMNFCAMKSNRKLPTPNSREEENELIESVKAFHIQTECHNYLIGYKLNRYLRYKSLDGNKFWPPLKENPSASTVSNDRDCVRVQLTAPGQDFGVIDFKPCKDVVDYHCVIGYKTNQTGCGYGIGEFCFHTVYANGFNPEDMFRNYKKTVSQSGMEEYGLLLLDREHLALSYTSAVYSLPKICWALDVKYDFDYLNVYEQGPSPYNISVILNDPEQDCLVINNDFQIETTHCSIGGCPLCEKSQILKKLF